MPTDARRSPARILFLANAKASRYDLAGQSVHDRLAARSHVTFVDLVASEARFGPDTRLCDVCADCDVVVVAGGDGTISNLLDSLIAWGRPVAILPLGTANDLARSLGLPDDPAEAIDLQLDGTEDAIDVGVVNGHTFINVASIGLGAGVAREMDAAEKAAAGVWSYPMALWRAWWRARRIAIRLTVDGRRMRRRIVQLGVANGRYHGGGIAASEAGSLTDGRLDVYCIRAAPFHRLLWAFLALGFARHREAASIETYQASIVTVETARPVDINADGELVTRTPARFEVRPRALPVMRPAAPAASSRAGVADERLPP